jgi:hypothetical protein
MAVDPLNPVYSSLDGALFDKTQQTLIGCPRGRVGTYNIPSGVTNIGPDAFADCTLLSTVTIPDSVTSIGVDAFAGFEGLSQITIPNSVVNVSTNAFAVCTSLTNVTVGSGVTNIDDFAFDECTNLHSAYFKGNAPHIGDAGLYYDGFATVYYLPGTTGWGPTFGGRPTVLWNPQAQTNDGNFGVRQNHFGFNIAGTPDIPLVIEASSNLAARSWTSLQSCTLTNGSIYFSDPQWSNYPARLYRIRSP